MNINPIKTDQDHKAALAEIEKLWDAADGSEEADKLDVLVTLVEKYEDNRWPIAEPDWDPVDILQYAINELGHTQAELAEMLGSRPRASEILSRARHLTVDMVRTISTGWKIPAELLVRRYRDNAAA